MKKTYDVIVVGAGGMGSAALWQLARRGATVLGIDRYDIPNHMGSSHGISRIIRMPYYEHPAYVPLIQRAYELWSEIEALSGERLLVRTGSIDGGLEDGTLFQGALASAELHGLSHEVLNGAEVNARFPAYRLPSAAKAVLQPDGGLLASEAAIAAHVSAAQAAGAEVHAREQVIGWSPVGDLIEVETNRGRYRSRRLVITTGAWIDELICPLAGLAVAERQVLAWLQPDDPRLFQPERFPVFNLEVDEGRYYGLPIFTVPGFKFGRYHHLAEYTTADLLDREVRLEDEDLLRTFASRYFPSGNGPIMSMRVCAFTNTPDEHFLIDFHPEHPQVVFASPCSGHGYKFCSVIGEILADLALTGHSRNDISFLRFDRATLQHLPKM